MRSRPVILLALVGIVAIGAGYGLHRYLQQAPAAAASEPLPSGLQLSGLDGHPHTFEEWHGKLLLVNFWATWCTPCLHEIPQLVKLQKEYAPRGLQIVGPAVDDPDAVRSMQGPLGINYPVLTASPDAMIEIMEKLGNGPGGLPFSVLVGPDGEVLQRQLGEFTPAELSSLIEAHLPLPAAP